MFLLLFSVVDFVKFFRSGDHFHQDHEKKYSRIDAPKTHVGEETSDMIVEDEKNYNESAFSINIMCPGNIDKLQVLSENYYIYVMTVCL